MEIRLVRKEELPILQQFIHDYWKNNHIMSTNTNLMNYQHYNGDAYNFVVAIENKVIYTALGFIPTSQYDLSIKRLDIWLAIWIKSPDCPKGLGVKLLDFIEEGLRPDTIGAIGINENIERLYLNRGWKSGVLNHYYFTNIGNIAKYEPNDTFKFGIYEGPFTTIPEKSIEYIQNRYLDHPFYNYESVLIGESAFIFRLISVGRSICIRIVDIFGTPPANLGFALTRLVRSAGADYIDCLNYGISPGEFIKMGFSVKPDNLILPNWFEPFLPEHHPIKFAYKAPAVTKSAGGETWQEDNYVIFKGDSDQDRPNQINR